MRSYTIQRTTPINIDLLDQQLRVFECYRGCSVHRQVVIVYVDGEIDLRAVQDIIANHDALVPSPTQAERAQRQREREALAERLASGDDLTLAELQRALQLIERILRAYALV
ncbi:MAG: hypothetical protein ACFE0Q_01635 [Anaerolineae bacterium]